MLVYCPLQKKSTRNHTHISYATSCLHQLQHRIVKRLCVHCKLGLAKIKGLYLNCLKVALFTLFFFSYLLYMKVKITRRIFRYLYSGTSPLLRQVFGGQMITMTQHLFFRFLDKSCNLDLMNAMNFPESNVAYGLRCNLERWKV